MARDDDNDPQDPAEEQALAAAAMAAAPSAAAREPVGPEQTAKGPARFGRFLKASWAELQRVQWPDRRQVGQATAVVLGFVVVAGAYLGLADQVAERFVDIIL
ncbi:preprotein translocase subunit SecE [Paraconexibacter sp.]|uniref:preprotein translocase subunit SecE n=1 Tax=Paraconexibacter sp. TaxID=2949640 RepID=UPI0035697B59